MQFNQQPAATLLSPDDAAPVAIVNPQQQARIVLTCEHAGRAVPKTLADLGIAEAEMDRHIAYDLGAEALARLMSEMLDASLVVQNYSRLVVDCNRPFAAPDCIPERSDGTTIPANANLSERERGQRFAEIHQPFHKEIERILDAGQGLSQPVILISVHSFTPSLGGADRPWQLGLLYNRDKRLAHHMMQALRAIGGGLSIAFNRPYAVDDISDYTIPVHGEARAIPHLLLEVRNDELGSAMALEKWAVLLTRALRQAVQVLDKLKQ